MTYILTGSTAFALIATYDWAQMRGHTWLKPLFFLSGVVFFIGLHGVLSTPIDINFPHWVSFIGWACLCFFSFLLIYSILIEISIKSYLNRDNEHALIDTGTYALSRHPGVLWFTGAAVSIVLLHPTRHTILAAVFWTIMDLLLVWVEDRYFFPNTITGYNRYKTTVPFLLPTAKSIRRCLKTIKPKRMPDPEPIECRSRPSLESRELITIDIPSTEEDTQ